MFKISQSYHLHDLPTTEKKDESSENFIDSISGDTKEKYDNFVVTATDWLFEKKNDVKDVTNQVAGNVTDTIKTGYDKTVNKTKIVIGNVTEVAKIGYNKTVEGAKTLYDETGKKLDSVSNGWEEFKTIFVRIYYLCITFFVIYITRAIFVNCFKCLQSYYEHKIQKEDRKKQKTKKSKEDKNEQMTLETAHDRINFPVLFVVNIDESNE
ncbi:hypothetical protein PVAND_000499 [Polypedilum vanderplanki]|uniref:Uncharacterized protein n=1 Tax=Polypedilum vanderplanki TaxID=319348 RepID=A0A9J6BLH1_POLVA|nr:hypothetical protein PVAND_000499 [Polypedilum vanderplanki]